MKFFLVCFSQYKRSPASSTSDLAPRRPLEPHSPIKTPNIIKSPVGPDQSPGGRKKSDEEAAKKSNSDTESETETEQTAKGKKSSCKMINLKINNPKF